MSELATASSDPAALASEIQGLIRRADFTTAIRLGRQAVGDAGAKASGPADVPVLYALAVAQRYAGNTGEALATIRRLSSLQPQHARAWQETGHLQLARNALPEAERAYERAVMHNPALLASWKALVNLYALYAGDNEDIARKRRLAEAELAWLGELPRELLSVAVLLHDGELDKADRLCRHFLRAQPHHVEGMRLLARVGERLEVLTDAEFLLETALALAPHNPRVRYDYANLLLKMQKFGAARVQAQTLVDAAQDNLSYQALLANACAGAGDTERAIALYDQVLAQSDGQHRLLVMRGHALKTLGKFDAAVAAYQAAHAQRHDYGDAWWSLANTKTYRFSDAEVRAMRDAESAPATTEDDRIHLCFALGKAYADRRDYAEAFVHYARGNALKAAGIRHKPEYLTLRRASLEATFTPTVFEQFAGAGCAAPDPVFIVGLPRAGSTLLEQILASHSTIDGTQELPNIIALAQRLRRSEHGYPAVVATLDADYLRRFGEQFLAETRIYRGSAPLFIDKNPNNFFHIGLIRLMLPNARIIDARRHPMACCWSGFKQLFGQGQEFSYDLATLGNYYREYLSLMRHWDAVLPGFVLRVQHEDVVNDLEGQVRRMLDFLQLPFEQACVDFHASDRPVRTPSSQQVRQPIYRDALDEWRHYETWLAPLKEALGEDVCQQFGIR